MVLSTLSRIGELTTVTCFVLHVDRRQLTDPRQGGEHHQITIIDADSTSELVQGEVRTARVIAVVTLIAANAIACI